MKTNKAKKPGTLLLILVAVILSASYIVFKSIAKPGQIAEIGNPEIPESPPELPAETIPLALNSPQPSLAPSTVPSPSPSPELSPEKPEVFVMTPENVIPLVYRVNTPGIFIPGDLNQDHYINLADYNLLIAKYGNPYTLTDYNNIVKNYGKTSQ
jgi:hypothetical protein